MCDPVSAIVAATVVSAGTAIYTGEKQREAMQEAQAESRKQAEKQAKEAETMANSNAQKARKPTSPAQALYGAADKGVGSTSLTGPQGVDNSQLTLGKSSLLGS